MHKDHGKEGHQAELRAHSIRLISYLISLNVDCLVQPRQDVDWLTAESYVDGHTEIVSYLVGQTSPGISADAFNRRFSDYIVEQYIRMTMSREIWLPTNVYGEIKPLPALFLKGHQS